MGLPKVNLPLYEKTIPSTGKKIKFRPFSVKEQKILLLAMESDSKDQMTVATKQILSLCIQDDIDIDSLALFDIEYLFLNIAGKSSGEVIDFLIKCDKCEEPNDYSINITDLSINLPDIKNNTIKLDNELGIVFKYPSIDAANFITDDSNKLDVINEIMIHCIDYIFDTESVYYPKDYSKEEMDEFIDSLSSEQIKLIDDWFKSIPEIKELAKFTCSKCGHENEFEIKGIRSFL
jgi:hypothetical protein